jgi:hypothetical protein
VAFSLTQKQGINLKHIPAEEINVNPETQKKNQSYIENQIVESNQ